MGIWAGIDEAGYGPMLGPLVVCGVAFACERDADGRNLWRALRDAVCRRAQGSDGRLVVNDSKRVYTPRAGLRRLEEGVLAFAAACEGAEPPVDGAGGLLASLGAPAEESGAAAWFAGVRDVALPVATNPSALESKLSVLRAAMGARRIRVAAARAAVVLPGEFNRIVHATRNKSYLLFQKCGGVLQSLMRQAGPGTSRIVVDRHGGRMRYRRLLLDVFPGAPCDVLGEEPACSTYRIALGDQVLLVSFREGADGSALPVALASMFAKYLRELHMMVFNAYWRSRLDGLRPTAGYRPDARRFLRDIAGVLREEGVAMEELVRAC
jgi:hypothetical protein